MEIFIKIKYNLPCYQDNNDIHITKFNKKESINRIYNNLNDIIKDTYLKRLFDFSPFIVIILIFKMCFFGYIFDIIQIDHIR